VLCGRRLARLLDALVRGKKKPAPRHRASEKGNAMFARSKAPHRAHPAALAAVALAAAIASLAAPATAHEVTRETGFYLGAKFVGSSLHVDDDGDQTFRIEEDGGGVLLIAGYSFNRVFSLEMALGGTSNETSIQAIDANLGTLQLFVHYRFMPGYAFRPYVKGGVGGYGLRLTDGNASVRIEGGGIPLGGGFDYFFSNHFSLGVDLTHNIISYHTLLFDLGDGATAGFDMDEDGAMTTLGLAVTGYF
jgi:hypothetical protein